VSQSYIDKEPSGIQLPKVMLGKELPIDEIKKMLGGEKTSLIKGFRSNKTHRNFDAYLKLEKGKIKFEFPPREFKPRRFGKKKEA
jgi:DNA topoisomerase-3